MYIFIDESGIHKVTGRSSVALVCVAVDDLDRLNKAILQAEKDLIIDSFHWSKHNWKIRRSFLEKVIKENFSVKIALFPNPFSEEIFQVSLNVLLTGESITRVIIDGKKTKNYILRLKQTLRRNHIWVKKVRTANDLSFPCLRLADLFAGLIRTYFENPNNPEIKYLYKISVNKITTQIILDGQASS